MTMFEGIGIPPDYQSLNTENDIENGFDPVLVDAINRLSQEN